MKTLDIQPGNILFSLPNINSLPESDLQADITQSGSISKPVEHVDGKVDLQSPRYTVILQPLTSLATVEASFTIRISDMGGGQYFRRECWCCSALTSPISASLTLVNTTTPISPIVGRKMVRCISHLWRLVSVIGICRYYRRSRIPS